MKAIKWENMPILLFGQQTGCNQLKPVKINRSFSGLLIFKMPQLQPVLQLHLVVFGPVLVIFLVLATGPLNTTCHTTLHIFPLFSMAPTKTTKKKASLKKKATQAKGAKNAASTAAL